MNPAAAVAAVVAAMGGPGFPARFREALQLLTGGSMCSAFSVGPDGGPRYLFAAGPAPRSAFARAASLRYSNRFWRHDPVLERFSGAGARDDVQILHLRRDAIGDADYRYWCYDVGGVAERVSLYRGGARPILASAYRTVGGAAPQPPGALAAYAPVLLAAVDRHRALCGIEGDAEGDAGTGEGPGSRQPLPPHGVGIAERLVAAGLGLTGREAQALAGILRGRTQQEIAEELAVATSTVITYRRRAYHRLGVTSRRELAAWFDALGPPGPGPSSQLSGPRPPNGARSPR